MNKMNEMLYKHGLEEMNCNTLIKFRQKRPALFRILQSFVDCLVEMYIRYNFFIDLESIQYKLSSDYSLNICFLCCFPHIDGPPFSLVKIASKGTSLKAARIVLVTFYSQGKEPFLR